MEKEKIEILKLNISGIKCDRCTFKDMSVEAKHYGYWVNQSCPECGANLMTEEDYASVCKMQSNVRKINDFFNRLPKFIQKLLIRKDNKKLHQPVTMDGSGKVNMDLSEGYEVEQ